MEKVNLAWVLLKQGKLNAEKLRLEEVKVPRLAPDQVLLSVQGCAICRTDLHIIEGDIPPHKMPIVLGHQVVGEVVEIGAEVPPFWLGKQVGLPWLHSVDLCCSFCQGGRENLCANALFTGYDVDGGFADFVTARNGFFYQLPSSFSCLQAAPLLCGGVIGFRAFRFTQLKAGDSLCLYGFGSSAHLLLQLCKGLGIRVFVRSRSAERQALAIRLGAEWAGDQCQPIPDQMKAGIIFAPSGDLIPLALRELAKGGRLVLAGIHMSQIPSFPYSLIYEERSIFSVANSTRQDVLDFLILADQHGVIPEVSTYNFPDLFEALTDLKEGSLKGTAVLQARKK